MASLQSNQLEEFQLTSDYYKVYSGKFAKIHRLARMHNKLMVKAGKAAQKRAAQ